MYVKTSASSASVTYTAYDADDYVLATGTVSFDANDSDDTITSSGASFKAMAAVDQITEEYPEAEYVKLDLPRASEGKLYYDFNTISDFSVRSQGFRQVLSEREHLAGRTSKTSTSCRSTA